MIKYNQYDISDCSPSGVLRVIRREQSNALNSLNNFDFKMARIHLQKAINIATDLHTDIDGGK